MDEMIFFIFSSWSTNLHVVDSPLRGFLDSLMLSMFVNYT